MDHKVEPLHATALHLYAVDFNEKAGIFLGL